MEVLGANSRLTISLPFAKTQSVHMHACIFMYIYIYIYKYVYHIRRRGYCVYGTGGYKVLKIEKLFQSKIIWEENNSQNIGNVKHGYRNETNRKFFSINLNTQIRSQKHKRKMGHHAGGKWSIHSPKHRKDNQLLSLEHSCWLSLIKCANLIQRNSMVTCPIRFSKWWPVNRNNPVRRIKAEPLSHTLIISY